MLTTTSSSNADALAILEQQRSLFAQYKRGKAAKGLASIQKLPEQVAEAAGHTLVGNNMSQVLVLTRKWRRYCELQAEAGRVEMLLPEQYEPALTDTVHFATWGFHNRDHDSSAERGGMGDSWELQVRYMLPKYVWPHLKLRVS